MKLKKKVFIDILQSDRGNGIRLCLDFVENNQELKKLAEDEEDFLEKKLKILEKNLIVKFKKFTKNPSRFEKANLDWIDSDFDFDFKDNGKRKEPPKDPTAKGAPNKSFEESARETKRIKISKLSNLSQNNCQLGLASVKLSAKRNKNLELQTILKAVIENQQDVFQKLLGENLLKMSPSEGLELLLHLNLSKFQYMQIRKESMSRGADLYPTYDQILKPKFPFSKRFKTTHY